MVSVGAAAAHRYQGLQIEFSGNVHRVRWRQVPDGRRVSHFVSPIYLPPSSWSAEHTRRTAVVIMIAWHVVLSRSLYYILPS